jgi:hypothetical protein
MSASLPPTLRTASPAEGLDLARRLAVQMLGTLPAANGMADHLKTLPASRPAPEMVTAVYFHAISLANAGWTGNRSG